MRKLLTRITAVAVLTTAAVLTAVAPVFAAGPADLRGPWETGYHPTIRYLCAPDHAYVVNTKSQRYYCWPEDGGKPIFIGDVR